MLEQVGRFLVSLLVTNWLYCEAVLLIPQLEPQARRIMQVARIPTHNEWPGIMTSPNASSLETDIERCLAQSSFKQFFAYVGILNAPKGGAQYVQAPDGFVELDAGSPAFVFGDAMFVNLARPWEPPKKEVML